VLTNGTFKVGEGASRALEEGQRLRADGLLFSPSGSVVPVFDHAFVQGRTVTLIKNGEGQPLTQELTFKDGSRIRPDGTLVRSSGLLTRLPDGHRIKLDGTVIPSRDTATLRDGQVWVQKDGALLRVQPVQVMLMNDGSRVSGSGMVTTPDGVQHKLVEGQTVLVEGAATRHR
jgi:hypothetical protein